MEITKDLLETQIRSLQDSVLRFTGAIALCEMLKTHLAKQAEEDAKPTKKVLHEVKTDKKAE